ncbi:hypothetical protein AVEN_133830-1 [Araneus ventricosus]|uniref:Uncharacterized protein n=1 Tax=Araneus ventricosus TaxID=182803 RepID=A0A4Y2PMI3_ARAVE|nr:hypothetical protein AVEN_255125-1 [Araneus ventricosus]GBN53178.1 hypothetical protein AVEN_133830-1 [Araneus ventricosus]
MHSWWKSPFFKKKVHHSFVCCWTPKWEAKTRHGVSLVQVQLTTLEEDLKQQLVCQDSPKDVLSDSGLEIELAIPFAPNCDPQDSPQQPQFSEAVHYHPLE